jgi:hypothetical protein
MGDSISGVLTRRLIRVLGSRSASRDATMGLRYTIEVATLAKSAGVLALIRGVARAARCRQASTGKGAIS